MLTTFLHPQSQSLSTSLPLPYSLTPSLLHSFTPSHLHSLNQSLTHSLTSSLPHTFTLSHSLPHCHPHSLTSSYHRLSLLHTLPHSLLTFLHPTLKLSWQWYCTYIEHAPIFLAISSNLLVSGKL
jgi:hypothetical protein